MMSMAIIGVASYYLLRWADAKDSMKPGMRHGQGRKKVPIL
jgi:hypothetical protein